MASEVRLDLISNGTATGSGAAWLGGRGTFFVDGTFGGATVALQAQMPNGTTSTWIPIQTIQPGGGALSLTAPGALNFELPPCLIRAAVTGGTPSGIYASAIGTRVS